MRVTLAIDQPSRLDCPPWVTAVPRRHRWLQAPNSARQRCVAAMLARASVERWCTKKHTTTDRPRLPATAYVHWPISTLAAACHDGRSHVYRVGVRQAFLAWLRTGVKDEWRSRTSTDVRDPDALILTSEADQFSSGLEPTSGRDR